MLATLVFSVLHEIANLLASVQGPAMLHLVKLDLRRLKNCAPPLNPALHCHLRGRHFTTTQTMVDNRPTLRRSYTDNLAKTGLTVGA